MLQHELMPFIHSDWEHGPDSAFFKTIPMTGNGITKMSTHQLPPLETKVNGSALTSKSPLLPPIQPPNGTITGSILTNEPLSNSPLSPASYSTFETNLRKPRRPHRQSSPARFSYPPPLSASSPTLAPKSSTPLLHRHTLEVPPHAIPRFSTEQHTRPSGDSVDTTRTNGRLSPSVPKSRGTSFSLGRRLTRSIHSDLHLDDAMLQDEDASRFAEAIKAKRASRRRRKEEEDDDRVVVGTKVDQTHVNWVTAYNMLTGIRFTVSRTNAKIPPLDLNGGHFEAKNKFSFDV